MDVNRRVSHDKVLIWLSLWALVISAVSAQAVGRNSSSTPDSNEPIEITRDVSTLLRSLQSLPYSVEGTGPIMYVLEFSTCPYSKRFESDWSSRLKNIEMRRVFYGVDEMTMNIAGAVGISRDARVQRAYMFSDRRAPDIRTSQRALSTYNTLTRQLEIIRGVLRRNDWPLPGLRSPHFFYSDGKRVLTDAGYDRMYFAKTILPLLRAAEGAVSPFAREVR